MSCMALCNLILPGFPASFPPLLPQIPNPSCTKLLTWNFSNTLLCFIIQCTSTCRSCCLQCPPRGPPPMLDECLFILQDSAVTLFSPRSSSLTFFVGTPVRLVHATFSYLCYCVVLVHDLSFQLA